MNNNNNNNGIDLEIIVSSKCNLNCFSCDHCAPIADEYFLTEQEIKNYLILLKKNNIKINSFILLGGEPFLNKNLLKICLKIRKFYPKKEIKIISNGILINKISIKDLQLYRSLNIIFLITPYINVNYINIKNILLKNNIKFSFLQSRLLFGLYTVNKNDKKSSKEKFYNCQKYNVPCYTLYKNKIYYCPFGYSSQFIGIPEEKSDFLNINDISNDKIKNFSQCEKNKCNYCNSKLDSILWRKSDFTIDEYLNDIKDYYLYNYDKYLEIINNKEYIDAFFKDSFFLNNIDLNYNSRNCNLNIVRFFASKIDIIIPFYNITKEILLQLENTLLKQTIIKECVIYFVSDNSPYEEEVFDYFYNHKILNCVFLKNTQRKGPGEARNNGIKNSYGKYLFFLDIDDELILEDGLNQLFNIAEKINDDTIIKYNVIEKDFYENNAIYYNSNFYKFLFPRKTIVENNIFYPPFFINEDMYFIRKIKINKNIFVFNSNLNIYKYNKNILNEKCLGNEFNENIYICAILSSYIFFLENEFALANKDILNIFMSIISEEGFLNNNNDNNKSFSQDLTNFSIYFGFNIYKKYKNILFFNSEEILNKNINNNLNKISLLSQKQYDSLEKEISFFLKNKKNDIEFKEIIKYLKDLKNK